MEYTIVKKTNVDDLMTDVNSLIAKGWKACGGISIAFGRVKNESGGSKNWLEVLFHAQALVKE